MIMVSKPNKIILESIAKVKGVSVDKVRTDIDKKKMKKKKKKKNDATIELVTRGRARTVEFSQVKGSLGRTLPKDNVFDWKMKDVALYIRVKYDKKFDEDWRHRTAAACTELMRIHDRILDIYGHCDFVVMKDYIDYIFEDEIEGILDRANGVFYLRNLRDDKYITAFSKIYDYKESFERATWGGEKKSELVENLSTSIQSIEEIFLLSEEFFVTTYGIVVCIFWLIRCQGYTNKSAAKKVLDICKKLHQKGEFKLVKEQTELLSPYHESINFPKMEEFLKSIDGRYKIDIEYKENDIIKSKFKFLEEKE